MRSLTEEQIDFIAEDIRVRGVFMKNLEENLLDHICCFIEEADDDRPFEQVYLQAVDAFGPNGLQEVQDETLFLINQPYQNAMKKFAYITGALASTALMAGALFKVAHWPGANILLIFGTLVLAMFFVPYFFYVNFKEQSDKKSKVIAGIGLVSALLLCASALFKILHWPGAIVMIVAFGVFFLVFLPLYVVNGMRNPLTKVSSLTNGFLFAAIGGFVILLSFQQPSKAVTDSLAVITENQTQLLNSLKSTHAGDTTTGGKSVNAFVMDCDAALATLNLAYAPDGSDNELNNGMVVEGIKLDQFNAALTNAVDKLNAAMGADPSWKKIEFAGIDRTLMGSLKFQVMQLEELAYVNGH